VGREETLRRVRELGLLAVVRGSSGEAALEVVDALVAGGVTGIEVTFTTPEADAVIAELARRHGDDIVLGAGTLTRPEHVETAVAAGSTFLVSPGCEAELFGLMRDSGLAVMPGSLTPTEVMLAQRLGADVVKIFPGSLGGPGYLKSLQGPFPDIPLMPTGGVSAGNVGEWFAAGAFAVGVGGALVPPSLEGIGRDEVVAKAQSMVQAVRAAQSDAGVGAAGVNPGA
jgi:2-dehydro-3-deoxyphosphogluconate aldolase/(4S)-4-hydroxy-2-oxoglutarate aldolase